ncbi:MAG: DUF4249 domain-containing protein [Fulvivirga sp.]|nr:DUF4249 domain-containing protein [Fulvivirga sp.]
MKHLIIIWIITLLTGACIDPAGIKPADFNDFLVVEGFITDQPGPHPFKITRVVEFSGILEGGVVDVEENIVVSILHEDGTRTKLNESLVTLKQFNCFQGTFSFFEFISGYETPANFRGEVGSTYTLEIATSGGEIYRSEPQTIKKTVSIDSVHLSFKEIPSLNDYQPRSGVEIFSSWQDPAEEENFYFWQTDGIYRIRTLPSGKCCFLDEDGSQDCYIHEPNVEGNLVAFSDDQVNGSFVTKKVAFIEDDGWRFANNRVPPVKQYYLELKQYEITEENYKFNQAITTLEEINGEIFDPPPLSVRGNIRNVNDPEDIVIGYFGAYQEQKVSLFIPSSLFPFKQQFNQPCGDCRVIRGAKTEVPEPFK